MHISIEELREQLQKHIRAHEGLSRQLNEVVGSIKIIQRLIAKISQPGEPNATKEGQQQEGSASEHQDGASSGEAPEASGGDSVEQSGQEQQQEEQVA